MTRRQRALLQASLQDSLNHIATTAHVPGTTRLKLRVARQEPSRVYGWSTTTATSATIGLTIWPTITRPHVCETLLHEIIHVVLAHTPRHLDLSNPHGPLFWATMTTTARDLGWISHNTILSEDGMLTLCLSTYLWGSGSLLPA